MRWPICARPALERRHQRGYGAETRFAIWNPRRPEVMMKKSPYPCIQTFWQSHPIVCNHNHRRFL